MNYVKYFFAVSLIIMCSNILAQVPVREEPHHKMVLENDYVRLLDVHIKPGDTTLYHVHAAPSVMVHITKSTIGSQIMGEAVIPPAEVLAGQTRFAAYDEKPITHRVFNDGTNVFHVMDIELVKKNPSPDSCTSLQQGNMETTINEKLVRVYKFDLSSQQTITLLAGSCAHLLICISGEVNTTNKNIKTGEFVFFNPHTEITVGNKQAGTSTYVLLELK
ncbi:MAG: hypothetical protein ACR2FN_05875 [Chitinophagaceae bacterium]